MQQKVEYIGEKKTQEENKKYLQMMGQTGPIRDVLMKQNQAKSESDLREKNKPACTKSIANSNQAHIHPPSDPCKSKSDSAKQQREMFSSRRQMVQRAAESRQSEKRKDQLLMVWLCQSTQEIAHD